MEMFDDIDAGIESLTISDITSLQIHLAPLGLQMLRDILARAVFEARVTQIAERRRQILRIFRDYELSPVPTSSSTHPS
jgi:hypothetical protein